MGDIANIIIEMSKFECNVCSSVTWVFPANDQEIRNLRCNECRTWIMTMQNMEQAEKNILNFEKEQY